MAGVVNFKSIEKPTIWTPWIVTLVLAIMSPEPLAAASFSEAPNLSALVAKRELPPVEERLPRTPLLVEPVERPGDYGGTWRMAILGDEGAALIHRAISYEPLVRWDPTWHRTVPGVAQSVDVNANATEYTFQLRDGMRWSDGAPFTVDDVIFWAEKILPMQTVNMRPFQRMLSTNGKLARIEREGSNGFRVIFAEPHGLFLQNLASGISYPGITAYPKHVLAPLLKEGGDPKATKAAIRDMGAANWDEMFRIKSRALLSRVDPGLLFRIAPPDRVTRIPDDYKPFPTLDAWTISRYETGSPATVVAERNPFYWKIDPFGRQLPYLDRVTFRILSLSSSDTARSQMAELLRNGEIDMQVHGFDQHPASPTRVPLHPDLRLLPTINTGSNVLPIALHLNTPDKARRQIFQLRDFRVALSIAIDRNEIIRSVLGGYGQPYQVAPVPESRFYHERLAKQHLEFDPGRAERLLDALGLDQREIDGIRTDQTGRRLSFEVLVRGEKIDQIRLLQSVVEYWRRIGVEARLVPLARREVVRHVGEEWDHDAVIAFDDGGMEAIMSPENYVPVNETAWYGMAWNYWSIDPSNPWSQEPPASIKEQISLYRQINTISDQGQQTEMMRQVLDRAADEFYMIGISLPVASLGVIHRRFRNVPSFLISAFVYPTPGPINPSQFFIDGR